MSELGPILELKNGDETIYAHRLNTGLFTFIGDHACYDHVFVHYEEEDDVTNEADDAYLYMFKSHSMFGEVKKFIETNNFPQHLWLPEASEIDQEVFEKAHYQDIRSSDFPPDLGTEDGTA